jgi:hypothetical protein
MPNTVFADPLNKPRTSPYKFLFSFNFLSHTFLTLSYFGWSQACHIKSAEGKSPVQISENSL